MAVPKVINSQQDFSAGELDPQIKRNESHPYFKAGARQLSNMRVLNNHAVQHRPGRRNLFLFDGRVDEIRVSPLVVYRLCFGNDGGLVIKDIDGVDVATQPGATYAWRTATLPLIVWTAVRNGASGTDVIITFAGQAMKLARFDGVTWTFSAFIFQTDSNGNALVPFYRIAGPNITMDPDGVTGSISVVFSAPVLDTSTPSKHIGVMFRYGTRRLIVTAVADSTHATMTAIDRLAGQQALELGSDVTDQMAIGDLVIGQTSGCQGLITSINTTRNITVQIINNVLTGYTIFNVITESGEVIVTPSVIDGLHAVSAIVQNPAAVSVWDEQMISEARGWPQSCFADQNRLGLCDLPGTPSAILWSWIGLPYNFNTGGLSGAIPTADFAIAELAPGRRRVYHVVPGQESSEFVFTDRGLYYIGISATNPLRPGSVSFQLLSADGCAQVQPRVVQELILYINAGLTSVMSILAPGAYNRPYQTKALAELHSHLIKDPVAIAVPTDDSDQFSERYAYVLNSDGTLAVGKYEVANGEIEGAVGWVPWSGNGSVTWVSSLGSTVLFGTTYPGSRTANIEQLDADYYLDAAVLVNAAPVALVPPPGSGPLWWLADSEVNLMDNGTRSMGVYSVDSLGFLVPQGFGGEDLTSLTLVAGQPWTSVFEPFIAAVNPGADQMQRQRKRRLARATIYVANSTGFLFQRLFAGPLKPGGPALGSVVHERRVTTWNVDDDPTLPPPLREQTYTFKPLGRSHDPRVAFVKDTPGPLQVLEFGAEVGV